ncbi:hypothetical protein AUP68_09507 [Ilyonectria robusta]
MAPPIFRIFNPAAPKEDPAEKRRAQLRQAQQSYRKRKSRYAKGLEDDLAASKTHTVHLMLKNEELSNTVQALLQILAQNGIDIPDDSCINIPVYQDTNRLQQKSFILPPDNIHTGDHEVRYDARSNRAPPQLGRGDYTTSVQQLASPESLNDYEVLERQRAPQHQTSNGGEVDEWPQFSQDLQTPPSAGIRVCDVDQITVGMEFVLKIEEPCLGHVHGDPKQPQEPSGHALTATSQLHYLCPTPRHIQSPPSFQDTPAEILERLLALTPEVASDGEMTPIQAWNSLRKRPVFAGLQLKSLMILAERLRDAVSCHGFGAVVKHEVFETMVFESVMLKGAV